ncbi:MULTISPECIES: DUF3558 domain-containing protein [Actinoalloteichus]|uniref:DUF3558 domain-containing protein n=1 Tax=Actinoalloteichus TaxID=65496 RepID=UPI0018DD112A|nr:MULTISPECIES: DUF3558 domain-containing protein [Actinoalloteichus]
MVTVSIGGCAQEQQGNASPTEVEVNESMSTESPLPVEASLAPGVPSPKNIDGLAPCDFLTSDQAADLDLPAAGQEGATLAGSPECRWGDVNVGLTVAIYVETHDLNLSGIYSQEDSFAVFEPTEIAGHPAVMTSRVESNFGCDTYFGVNDDQLIVVSANVGSRDDLEPCEWGSSVAAAMAENL